MLTSISLRKLPVWLLVFFSPTVYFLSFLFANRFHVAPNLPEAFYLTLFVLILAGAVLYCVGASWAAEMTFTRKIVLTAFIALGLLLQCGVIFLILRAILIAITAYPK